MEHWYQLLMSASEKTSALGNNLILAVSQCKPLGHYTNCNSTFAYLRLSLSSSFAPKIGKERKIHRGAQAVVKKIEKRVVYIQDVLPLVTTAPYF